MNQKTENLALAGYAVGTVLKTTSPNHEFTLLTKKIREGDYLAVVDLCEKFSHPVDNQQQGLLLLLSSHAKNKLGLRNAALDDLVKALNKDSHNAQIYEKVAEILQEETEPELCQKYLPLFASGFIRTIAVNKDIASFTINVFDVMEFLEAGNTRWKEQFFEHFALKLLYHSIAKTYVNYALFIENEIFRRYLRTGGENYEQRFTLTTRKWYPLMEELGKEVAREKGLPDITGRKLNNNKIAFFIHNESTMAHIGTVFSILESYKARGGHWFDGCVFSLDGYSQEMRDIFKNYGLEVISLRELLPDKGNMERLLLLRALLQANKIERLVWVCLTTMMSFAFGLRLAPEQIWYTGSYYRGLLNKNIDKRALNTILADKVFENSNEWDVISFSISTFLRDYSEVKNDVEQIRNELLGNRFDCIIGALSREQKMQDESYISTIARVLHDNDRALFVWTGTQEDKVISSLIKKYGIEDRSHYLGWIDTSVYSHILDVFMDTIPFPCGVTFYQAMAAGKPTVSYRTDDAIQMGLHGQLASAFETLPQYWITEDRKKRLQEIFGNKGERFLFYDNVEDYFEAATKLVKDSAFREEIGNANRRLVREFLIDPLKMSESFDHLLGR